MKTDSALALLLSRNPLKVVPPEHQPKTLYSVAKEDAPSANAMASTGGAENPLLWDERWFGNYE